MLKKITAIFTLLTMTLVLCSCSTHFNTAENGYVKSADKYGYYHIFNLSYGMPSDDCIKTLDKTKFEDMDIAEFGESYNYFLSKAIKSDVTFLEKKSTAIIMFYSDLSKNISHPYLAEIRVVFEENTSVKDVISFFEVDFAQKGLSYDVSGSLFDDNNSSGGTITYRNNSTLKTLEDKFDMSAIKDLSDKMFGEIYNNPSNESHVMWNSIEDVPFDEITLYSADGDTVQSIHFSSSIAIAAGITENK